MKTSPLPSKNQIAAERNASLSRRGFLRGLGVCLALPAFESLNPLGVLAASKAAAKAAPMRTAFLYVPNGTIPSAWWPQGEGDQELQLNSTMQPLEKLRKRIQVISGLGDKSANAGPDGPGDHARAGGTFLTGVRIKKTAGSDIYAGISIDQVIANQIGHLTRIPSLELSCDAVRKSGNCDSGYSCAYSYNLTWRSATQPLAPEPNPRLLFERLFGAGTRTERLANFKHRQAEQRSILDFVLADARDVQRKLGGRDQEKLDQYLSSIREIERRIEQGERFAAIPNPEVDTPAGIPPTPGEHISLMFDMMLLAFQTDTTRVATMLLASEGSNRNFPELGISEGHHNLTHHKNDADMIAKVKQIDTWYIQQLADFLGKMEKTKDVDGNSLLHNSMILYGSGNADGNQHTHSNLPIILAGGGGGKLRTGRYVNAKSAPLTNLFVSMTDHAGLKGIENHGDSTGHLEGI